MDAYSLVTKDDSRVAKAIDGADDGRSEPSSKDHDLSSLDPDDGDGDIEDGSADGKHSVDTAISDKLSYSQLVDRVNKLEWEAKTKTKELEQRVRETERHLGVSSQSCLVPWRYSSVGAGPAGSSESTNNTKTNTKTFKLAPDMYSILSAWDWNTKPFWASLFVAFVQIALLSVLIADLIGGATVENMLNVPGNVEYTVRIAQVVALPVAVFKQEDLREGIEGLFQGMPSSFRGEVRFQSMKPMKWSFGYFLRSLQGFLSMFASFILLIQSETVFDLLLNFLGVEFISDLDNLSFRLAGVGYFGVTTRDCVHTIAEAEFRKDNGGKDVTSVKCSPSWWRKYGHILGVFFIFIAMVFSFIFYAALQYDGQYLPSVVKVEFGDERVPYLGIFNGCYARRGGLEAERFVFEQMGRSTLQGRLAYCRGVDDGSWVLSYGGDDPCEKHYIVASGNTKTFDVLETVDSQWYTNTGLPLEYLQIYPVDDEFASCGSLELLDETRDSCLEIELDLDGRSSILQKRQLSVSSEGKVFDAIRSHPIYVGGDGSESEVVIFTGRRWVLANSSKIGSWENTTTLLDDTGDEEFYDGLMEVDSEWILSISEPVDGVNDQGTPLGLQWYFPRDAGEESNTTTGFNFHGSDLTRPVGLTCASCNSKTNPCLYEGVCDDKTGKCECKHGASGKLCRERPSGDGTCNAYFNTEEFGYDAGDCCASTCGVSACDDSRIAFPFGIDVMSRRGNESRAVWMGPLFGTETATRKFGFDECVDPEQGTFTFETKPSTWRFWDPESPLDISRMDFDAGFGWYRSWYCNVDILSVTCDDKPYLGISSILVATTDYIGECPAYRQTFQVPYGASCEISYANNLQLPTTTKLFYGSDGAPIYEDVSAMFGTKTIGLEIPVSKCITETFSNTTKSIFDNSTIEGAVANRLSTIGRVIDWCESEREGDRDVLFERFALEALLTMLNATEIITGENHHCRVSILAEGFNVGCDSDNRVVMLKVLKNYNTTNGTLTDFMEFLHFLPKLELLTLSGKVLSGPIPTEIANLHNLKDLRLVDGTLTGTIPTEIFSLQHLEHVKISDHRLTGSIPPEVGKLERLNYLNLNRNLLTGTIPFQIGNLKNLEYLTLSNNSLSGFIPLQVLQLSKLEYCDILYGNSNMTRVPVGICN